MTYNVWTDEKPDLVASTRDRGAAFSIAAEHAETGAVLVTEAETGRSWVITIVENLSIAPRLELPAANGLAARD